MRIQILPRSTGSSKDFYKILVVFFLVVYVFLWLSRPAVENKLARENLKTSLEQKSILLINETAQVLGKDLLSRKAPSEFITHWCRQQRWRLDWKSMISPCEKKMAWNSLKDRTNATDPNTSFISLWDIKPVGEYSRFSIQSQTKGGRPKTQGGDTWRVLLRGPSSISPTVFDHGNGTYEVLFLALESGVYTANITLDYTLCDGFVDPPWNWFIIGPFLKAIPTKIYMLGNAQGKYQRHLHVDGNRDYLQAALWDGSPVEITIPPASDGRVSFTSILSKYQSEVNELNCATKCNFMWDGYGRWVQNKWKPHAKEPPKKHELRTKKGTLWIYGDSVNVFFAQSLMQRKLCRDIFKQCNFSYNWIYPVTNVTAAKKENDDRDYDNERVLQSLRHVLYDPQMDENSAIMMNFGLHFVESTNFTNYKKLIDGLVKVVTDEEKVSTSNVTCPKFRGTVIWKTTTAINKGKASNIHLGHKRFLTQQRILLYNAYATSRMCQAGFKIIDVFPITDSYPQGTGTHGANGPVKNDIVHYNNLVFSPAEDELEQYFDPKE